MAVYLKYGVGRPNHSTITVNNIIVFKTHMNVSAYKYIYAFLWKCIPYVNFHFMLIIIMFVEDTRLWHVLSVSTYIYIYILDFKAFGASLSTTTPQTWTLHINLWTQGQSSTHRSTQPIDMKNICLSNNFEWWPNAIRFYLPTWCALRVQIYMHHYIELNLPLEIVNCGVAASACHSIESIFI